MFCASCHHLCIACCNGYHTDLKYKVAELQSDLPGDFFSFGIKLITMLHEQRMHRGFAKRFILAEIIKRSLVTLHFSVIVPL